MKSFFSKLGQKKRQDQSSMDGFRCATCGQWHDGLPFDYAYDSPFYWSGLSEEEKKGSFLNSDLCSIQNEHFYVRGVIEIPVRDAGKAFRWGVWGSLNKKDFDRAVELWNDPRLLEEPPYSGWLASRIGGYPETLGLRTNIHFRSLEKRPYFELERTDHPLAVEQWRGMTLARVREIAARAAHPPKAN